MGIPANKDLLKKNHPLPKISLHRNLEQICSRFSIYEPGVVFFCGFRQDESKKVLTERLGP